MAQSKAKLVPGVDIPKHKVDITKSFMLDYMKKVATEDDKKWFKKIVSNPDNQKEYINRLNGKPYIDIDIPKVRAFFIERFYSEINEKKKKKAETFIEKINNL